jgi:Protein of unknown function (DUF3040)
MTENRDRSTERTRKVRPRWTWIALLIMVLGLVLIGLGVVVQSWVWAAPGVAALLVGAGIAWYAGFFYDVQGGSSISAQAEDVAEDAQHEMPVAGTMRSEGEVKRDVRRRWLDRGE